MLYKKEADKMDLKKELQRISGIINEMPIREFEDMLFECGLGVIGPSEESDFVKCFTTKFFENGTNYVRRSHIFSQKNYRNFNDFYFDGQEVA